MAPNKVYALKLSSENYALISVNGESSLWHLIFGHLHFNGLKFLKHKQMVLGLPIFRNLNKKFVKAAYMESYIAYHFLSHPEGRKIHLSLYTGIWGPRKSHLSQEKDIFCSLLMTTIKKLGYTF